MSEWDAIGTAVAPASPPQWDSIGTPLDDGPAASRPLISTDPDTGRPILRMGYPKPDTTQPAPPVSGFADFLQSLPGGIVKGFSNAASALGQATQGEMGQDVNAPDKATTGQLLEQNVTGSLPQPQGKFGQLGDVAGQFIGNPGSYIGPGSLPVKIGMAALGGIGSEGGRQLFAGTRFETPASILGSFIGGGAPTSKFAPVVPDAVQAAERIGVNLPRAIATENPLTRLTGQVIAKAPGGGPMTEAIPHAYGQMNNAVGNAADLAGGTASPMMAGEGFQGAIAKYFEPGTKAISGGAYDRVSQLVNPNVTTPLAKTSNAVANIAARRDAAGLSRNGGATDLVAGALERPNGLTFDGLKFLRTHVGEMLDTGALPVGVSQGEVKQIYGALSDDLKNAARNAGGEPAVKALEQANRVHTQMSEWKNAVRDVLGASNNKSGEGIYRTIVTKAGTGGGADLRGLAAARAAVPKEAWRNIASTAISTLGLGRNGEWKPDAFLTQYGKLSPQGKSILFGSVDPRVIPYLDDIAEVSKKFVEAGKLGNSSGTAGHNALYAGAGAIAEGALNGVWAHVGAVIGGIFGINMAARILASPVTASSMARWSKVYLRLAQSPNQASLSAFNRASGEFAKTVNSNFGTNAGSADFLRAIQSPQTGNADENK